jgi:hypothetical protein
MWKEYQLKATELRGCRLQVRQMKWQCDRTFWSYSSGVQSEFFILGEGGADPEAV